jgi:hypothetical protein
MRRLAVPSLAVLAIVACVAIVQSRPYDGAVFHGAEAASSWSQHLVRINGLQAPPQTYSYDWKSWLADSDRRSTPLFHIVAIVLTPLTGPSAEDAARGMFLWLLLVGLGAGVTAFGLTGQRDVAIVGGTATLLLPVLPASSLNYYNDLPMTALLWCSVGVTLLARRKGSLTLAALAGMLFAAACVTRWSAIPHGLPFVFGALVFPVGQGVREASLRRVLVSLTVVVVGAGLVGYFLSISTASWDELGRITLGEAEEDFGAIHSLFRRFQPPGLPRIASYAIRLLTAIFSPALALLALMGTARWVVGARQGAPLFVLGLVGNAVFLLFLLPPFEDRFLSPLAPALVLPAVLGWATASPRIRAAVAAAWVAIALGVVWDVHHGHPNFLNQRFSININERFGPERMPHDHRGRGLSLDSGDPAVGWCRADDAATRPIYSPKRESLFSYLRSCGAKTLVVADAALQDSADGTWWEYRMGLHTQLFPQSRFSRVVTSASASLPQVELAGRGPQEGTLLLLRTQPVNEAEFGMDGWHRVGTFELPNHPGLTVWGTADVEACPEAVRRVVQ